MRGLLIYVRQCVARQLGGGRNACWIGVGIVLAAAGSGRAQQGPTPVSVCPVVQREVASGQTFVGTVMPKRISIIGSAVAERVVAFPVNEGDRVKRGQPLARLRTQTLEIDLAAARAELELRKHELAELENGSRPEEITQARARVLSAKALMTLTETRLDRYQRLYKENQAAEDEVNLAVSSHDQAVQAHEEAKAGLALVVAGPRKEKIAQARARVQSQQEEIRRLQDQIERHTIVAPFDGYVVTEHTEVGQWLATGDPVVELAELDTVDVRVLVLEDYVRYLRVGTEARVTLGALPGRTFTGHVALIVPQADTRSRSFPVEVQLKNQEMAGGILLKAGMFARVTLPVGRNAKALLVPKDALVLGGPTPTVYVFDANGDDPGKGKVRPVSVVLGIASQGLIQVSGQLKLGQQVVARGNERLGVGQEVTIAERLRPERFGQAKTTTRASASEGK